MQLTVVEELLKRYKVRKVLYLYQKWHNLYGLNQDFFNGEKILAIWKIVHSLSIYMVVL